MYLLGALLRRASIGLQAALVLPCGLVCKPLRYCLVAWSAGRVQIGLQGGKRGLSYPRLRCGSDLVLLHRLAHAFDHAVQVASQIAGAVDHADVLLGQRGDFFHFLCQ